MFWNHFVPFLQTKGLKYSTIGHVKANLIAVLNWSSKYGVKLNPSYSEVDIPELYPQQDFAHLTKSPHLSFQDWSRSHIQLPI